MVPYLQSSTTNKRRRVTVVSRLKKKRGFVVFCLIPRHVDIFFQAPLTDDRLTL